MPDSQFYTAEAAIAKADDIKLALAASKLHLFKSSFLPDSFTTKAQLADAECDFDGYSNVGYALAAWTGPAPSPGGGAVLTSPLVYVNNNTPDDPPVGNTCGGFWIEDAGGDVRLVGIFNPPRPLLVEGEGFPWVQQIVEARNPQVTTEEV